MGSRVLLVSIVLVAASAAHASPWEVPVVLPDCGSGAADVKIISQPGDWAAVNSADYRVFCVRPGDYGAVDVRLTADGTADRPRYLVYDAPGGETAVQTHPVKMAPEDRAVIRELVFDDAGWWVVQGLFIDGGDRLNPSGTGIDLLNGSSHNVIDRVVVQHGGGTLVQLEHGSSYNAVQNSVIRETDADAANPSKDYHCFQIKGDSPGTLHNRIVRNEIYDCAGDSVHFSGCAYWLPNAHEISYDCTNALDEKDIRFAGDTRGTIVYDNDLYITPGFKDVCGGSCACLENAVDVKSTMGDTDRSTITADDWVRLERNRMWNDCNGGGDAIITHFANADYVLVRHNVIWNWNYVYRPTIKDDPFVDHHSIIGNVFADSRNMTTVSRVARDLEFYKNVVVNIEDAGVTLGGYGDSGHFDLQCNAFVDAAGWSISESVVHSDWNTFYDTAPFGSGADNQSFTTVAEGRMQDLCFERRRWTGPDTHCIANASPTADSPHLGRCPSDLGAYPDVGVHDDVDPGFFTSYDEAQAPALSVEATATPRSGLAPLEVAFTAQVTGAAGSPSWQWEFGDGESATESSPVHVYGVAGTYTAAVTVTDGASSASAAVEVTVTEPTSWIFSPIAHFGDFTNYDPVEAGRWTVTEEDGDWRLFLQTTDYETRGEEPGEVALVQGVTFDDFDLTLDVKTNEDLTQNRFADFAVVFGYRDAGNYHMLLAHAQSDITKFFRMQDGARTDLATLGASLIPDAGWHRFELKRRGDDIEALLDGASVWQGPLTEVSEGRVGIGSFDESVWFDDFEVRSPEAPPPTDGGVTPADGGPDGGRTDAGLPDGGPATDGGTDDAPDAGLTGDAYGEGGCSCSAGARPSTPVWALAVLGLAVLRRRRAR